MSIRWRAAAIIPVLGLGLALAAPAAAASSWVHVRVEQPEGENVRVNLPLGVVRAALALAPETITDGRHIRIDGHDHFAISDLKKLWQELRQTPEGELVTVESDDENVRVAREGEAVVVHVQSNERSEQVSVEVPVALVDALLAPEGDAIDVMGALTHLEAMRGDIVRVEGSDAKVRIWIDENAGSESGS